MNQPTHITVSPAKLEKTNDHIGTAGNVWELVATGSTVFSLAPALFRHFNDFMVNRQGFKVITNVAAGISVLLVAYLTFCNLSPIYRAGNLPVLIAGLFPIFASFAMFVGVLLSPPMSLLRIAYIAGMFIVMVLGV